VENAVKKPAPGQSWKVEDSLELYQVQAWGSGYFGINAAGHVVVRPDTLPEREIDLLEVVEGLQARDLRTPLGKRLQESLRGGVPDQGESTTPRSRRGVSVRRAIRLWA
jgi:arginine decarboxylase